jgi:hypothetical protein
LPFVLRVVCVDVGPLQIAREGLGCFVLDFGGIQLHSGQSFHPAQLGLVQSVALGLGGGTPGHPGDGAVETGHSVGWRRATASMDSESSGETSASEVEAAVLTRVKRGNAGNRFAPTVGFHLDEFSDSLTRLRALLENEVDLEDEEIFREDADDIEFVAKGLATPSLADRRLMLL